MKVRRVVKVAAFVWGAWRLYARNRKAMRVGTKRALKRASRAI